MNGILLNQNVTLNRDSILTLLENDPLPTQYGGTGNASGQAASVANKLSLSVNGSTSTYDGSSAVSKTFYAPTSKGSTNQVLRSTGGTPTWVTLSSTPTSGSSTPISSGGVYNALNTNTYDFTYTSNLAAVTDYTVHIFSIDDGRGDLNVEGTYFYGDEDYGSGSTFYSRTSSSELPDGNEYTLSGSTLCITIDITFSDGSFYSYNSADSDEFNQLISVSDWNGAEENTELSSPLIFYVYLYETTHGNIYTFCSSSATSDISPSVSETDEGGVENIYLLGMLSFYAQFTTIGGGNNGYAQLYFTSNNSLIGASYATDSSSTQELKLSITDAIQTLFNLL